jgi:acetyl-CoA carboxylase biotin carboxyl carrier protein
MEIKDIEVIIGMLKQSDVTEFELEHSGTKVRLVRTGPGGVIANGAAFVTEIRPAISHAQTPQLQVIDSREANTDAKLTRVESPIVGTFYRRPSPDAEPFVKEGDRVKKGSTLCIVEAMKLMNEIEAPVSGKIEKVLLTDGQVVEYGEVLFLIDPEA